MPKLASLGFVGLGICLLVGGCAGTGSRGAAASANDPDTDAAIAAVGSAQAQQSIGALPDVTETLASVPVAAAPSAPPVAAAPPGTRRSNTSANPDTIALTVPNAPSQPNVYAWRGQSYTGSDAFLAAVSSRVAEMVAGVEHSAPVGSLRILLPPRTVPVASSLTNPAGAAEGQKTVERALRLFDEGRVTALRHSGLFEPIQSETGSVVIPAVGSADFVLWFDNAQWNLRYRSGDPQSTGNVLELGTWVRQVRNVAQTAQARGGKPTLTLQTSFRPGTPSGVTFVFNGGSYATPEALNPVVRTAFQEAAHGIQPMTNRLGGRLKVVVLTTHAGGMQINMQGNPQANETMRSALANFNQASALYHVEALRNSRLFDEVVMETADLEDAPLGGFDYVLWEPAGKPLAWRYRSRRKSGDALSLISPASNSSIQQWLESVRDQLGSRAAGS
jgi:hypothetical protein